jgi:hypothetical protein
MSTVYEYFTDRPVNLTQQTIEQPGKHTVERKKLHREGIVVFVNRDV